MAQQNRTPRPQSSQAPEAPKPPEEDTTLNRDSRNMETRANNERPQEWRPPHDLHKLENTEDFIFRWLREEYVGQKDTQNMEKKLREGYQIVTPDDPMVADQVKMGHLRVESGRIVNGGLVLAKLPRQFALQRDKYYADDARLHQQSVNEALSGVRHKSMPLGVQTEERQSNSREG